MGDWLNGSYWYNFVDGWQAESQLLLRHSWWVTGGSVERAAYRRARYVTVTVAWSAKERLPCFGMNGSKRGRPCTDNSEKQKGRCDGVWSEGAYISWKEKRTGADRVQLLGNVIDETTRTHWHIPVSATVYQHALSSFLDTSPVQSVNTQVMLFDNRKQDAQIIRRQIRWRPFRPTAQSRAPCRQRWLSRDRLCRLFGCLSNFIPHCAEISSILLF